MRMKKYISIPIICIICFNLCACSLGDVPVVSDVLEWFDFPISGDYESPDEKESDEPPVIVFETEDEPVIVEEEIAEVEEVPEEPEDEGLWDDENKIYSKDAADGETVKLDFIGDISFADGYANMSMLRGVGEGIEGVLDENILTELRSADIFMLNNEFPYSDRGIAREGKKFTFRAQPDTADYLNDMGADIVSLANNHAYDYGPDALTDTVELLYEKKVPFVGAGRNYEEAAKPVYFKINNRTIAFVAATQIERVASPDTKEATEDSPGVIRTLDAAKFTEIIANAEANSDFVVVYVHWGSENTDLVEDNQRELAKKYTEAGADLIIGDHSHCLQGIDYVGDVPVIYSLGNFWFNSKTVDTCIFSVVLDTPIEGDVAVNSVRFIPCVQKGCKTSLASAEVMNEIIQYMQGISNYAVIDENGAVTKSDKDMNTQNGVNTCPNRVVAAPEESDESQPTDEEMLMQLLLQNAATDGSAEGQ